MQAAAAESSGERALMIKALTSVPAGQIAVRGTFQGRVPDGERFRCLTFLVMFMDPLGATRASSERHREVARRRG
jgi:hypothetical protein